jgi:S1-C subfamily serine protease
MKAHRALALCIALAALPVRAADPVAQEAPALAQLQDRVIEIAKRVTPSVVHVAAIVKVNDRRREVTGSGVIASADGRILTNHHVVEKAEKVTVTIPGLPGKIPARIVGSDKQTDIALLRVDLAQPLPAATFGSSDDVQVGQWVLAVGNPYGLDGTVSLGIVSAKGHNLGIPDLINDFIQTDAMIDRGSSGGPLVDLEGRVVGVNSRGQGRGIGFTIPAATALDVMRQLDNGGIERGWLGVSIQPFDRELAGYFGVPDETGVVVSSVTPRSPAAEAGIQPGDVLTDFAGTPIEAEKEEDLGNFQRVVARVSPGESAAIALLRGGARKTLTVKLVEAPKAEADELESATGFLAQEITETIVRQNRLATRRGAYVSFVASGSPAAEAGLEPGDVIRRVEDHDVANLEALRAALATAEKLPRFLITAERGEETRLVLLRPGAADSADDAKQSSSR